MIPFGAILSDLDGVLRHYDHAAQADIEARYRLPLMQVAFDPELITPPTLGRATEAQWTESIVAALGGDDRARQAVAEFMDVRFWVDEEVRTLLARAQQDVPVILVTNAMDTVEEHWIDWGSRTSPMTWSAAPRLA